MDIEFNKREDQNKLKLAEINRLFAEIKKVPIFATRFCGETKRKVSLTQSRSSVG